MFGITILGALLALSAGQPLVPKHSPFQDIVPEGQQYYPQYQEPYSYNTPFFNPNNPFGQYKVIEFVNNQNQPLGYVYSVNYEAVQQQQQNFIQVRSGNGKIVAYYSVNQYQPGQAFQYQVPSENVISQLEQFGFSYQPQTAENTAFFVVRNPNVFSYNKNGVLSPRDIKNQVYLQRQGAFYPYYQGQQYYYGRYPQQYPYTQRYQGPYAYQYQGPYSQYYPGSYPFQYQGQGQYPYQGAYSQQYQESYPFFYQGSYPYKYQGSYPFQYQGSYPFQYQGSYPFQYQGSYPYQYNQYVSAY